MNKNYSQRRRDPIERQLIMGLIKGIGQLLSLPFKKFLPKPTIDYAEVYRQWQVIESQYQGSPGELQSAILAADRLLDHVLKKVSFGSTMGERLKNAQNRFSSYESYQNAWEAHKVRNHLAHEMDHRIDERELRAAIGQYRRALEGLI